MSSKPDSSLTLLSQFQSIHEINPSDGQFSCIFRLSKQQYRRCLSKISHKDRDQAIALRYRLQTRALDEGSLVATLKTYAVLCSCQRHHRRRLEFDNLLLEGLIETWKAALMLSDRYSHRMQIFSPLQPSKLKASVPLDLSLGQAPEVKEYKAKENSTSQPVSSRTRSRTQHNAGTHNWGSGPPDRELAIRFMPYKTKAGKTIQQAIQRDLLPSERKTGGVYAFTRAGDLESNNKVKIGYSGNIDKRMSKWTRSCGYIPQILIRFDNVPHAKKVESIVQAELWQQRRREMRCLNPDCTVQHEEWFEVDVGRARAVMWKWTNWMVECRPYDANGVLTGEWRGTEQLDRLIQDPVKAPETEERPTAVGHVTGLALSEELVRMWQTLTLIASLTETLMQLHREALQGSGRAAALSRSAPGLQNTRESITTHVPA